ncbi:MAG: sulfotransferase [Proteobacteria bacterium]|nr:sulfotransferase [Pseudomonadota bacterium]MBU1710330.1 sulfotransferase [Pseudomonadota bacterium]
MVPFLDNHQLVFIGGLHRSGTSLLHEILRDHPEISGFSDTGVTQDEGMFLQNVYPTAKPFGGPGRFGFDNKSFMDEDHPLATEENAKKIFMEWGKHWKLNKKYLMEKSPPDLVRTRFLQKLFPHSLFIIVLRHPVAVAYATKKWAGSGIPSLIEHSLRCYERFMTDKAYLNKFFILRYEDFVREPEKILNSITGWIGINRIQTNKPIRSDINKKYFLKWEEDQTNFVKQILLGYKDLPEKYQKRFNNLGYCIKDIEQLMPVAWLGPNSDNKKNI